MYIPQAPMQFVATGIAFLPKDQQGYQYIWLIGDVFSKFVSAVPLREQTAKSIVDAFLKHWLYIHGTPLYLLSDQGPNVDVKTMKALCNKFGIAKRRSSAYHSQGNGFAERSIRTIKNLLRSVLLHRQLPQSQWSSLLPELIFGLNASVYSSTQCVPYNIGLQSCHMILLSMPQFQTKVRIYSQRNTNLLHIPCCKIYLRA